MLTNDMNALMAELTNIYSNLNKRWSKEFNSFSKGSIDGTVNTKKLVEQFDDSNTKLIVTTIQKLYVAIKSWRYKEVK